MAGNCKIQDGNLGEIHAESWRLKLQMQCMFIKVEIVAKFWQKSRVKIKRRERSSLSDGAGEGVVSLGSG